MPGLRCLLLFCALLRAGMAAETRLYINYSPHPPERDLLASNLCILDLHAQADLQPGHRAGSQFLAYVSLVEVARGSLAEGAARRRGVAFAGRNGDWDSQLMEVTSAAWKDFVLEDCAAAAFQKGYDGLFLDTLDSLERLDAARRPQARQAVKGMIAALHERWPGKKLVVNRGFDLLAEAASSLSGVLVESVYQGFDPATKRYRAVDAAGSRWLEARIRAARKLGLEVYAVDYVNPVLESLAQETAMRLKALGCVPLITTPALSGEVVAPIPARPRHRD